MQVDNILDSWLSNKLWCASENTTDGSKKTLTPSTSFLVACKVTFLLMASSETSCPSLARYLARKKARQYVARISGAEVKNTMRQVFM